MNLLENIKESLRAIRSNFLRAVLTMLVIAFGLMALIGVLTAFDGLQFWFVNQFASMGSNTVRISRYDSSIRRQDRSSNTKRNPSITYKQALEFKKKFQSTAVTGILARGNFSSLAKFEGKTTNNDIQLMGADENYGVTSNYEVGEGRNISTVDVSMRRNVTVIGQSVSNLLFPRGGGLDKRIQINGKAYTVIGIYKEKGMVSMVGGDKVVVIPVSTLLKDDPDPNRDYGVSIYVPDPRMVPEITVMSKGMMREVRNLMPKDLDNFGIMRLDDILKEVTSNLSLLTVSAFLIALITLFSATIGLMNIMLVSVTERTREIGVRKALGATSRNILNQFLMEAIIICQLGGILGIILGILLGNLVGTMLGSGFIVPWGWVMLGVSLCFIVGIVSGIYPAWKASSLDPIESLRFE